MDLDLSTVSEDEFNCYYYTEGKLILTNIEDSETASNTIQINSEPTSSVRKSKRSFKEIKTIREIRRSTLIITKQKHFINRYLLQANQAKQPKKSEDTEDRNIRTIMRDVNSNRNIRQP